MGHPDLRQQPFPRHRLQPVSRRSPRLGCRALPRGRACHRDVGQNGMLREQVIEIDYLSGDDGALPASGGKRAKLVRQHLPRRPARPTAASAPARRPPPFLPHSSPNPMPLFGVSVPARTGFSTTLEPGTQIEGGREIGSLRTKVRAGTQTPQLTELPRGGSAPGLPPGLGPGLPPGPKPCANPGGNPPPSTARTRGRGEALAAACGDCSTVPGLVVSVSPLARSHAGPPAASVRSRGGA